MDKVVLKLSLRSSSTKGNNTKLNLYGKFNFEISKIVQVCIRGCKDTNTFINKVQFHYIGLKCYIFLAIRLLYVEQPSDVFDLICIIYRRVIFGFTIFVSLSECRP